MKSALVFGGSGGIGSAITNELKHLGYKVVVADKRGPEEGLADKYVICDATQEADVRRALTFTQQNYGSVDVVVNSQGVYLLDGFEQTTSEKWQKIIDVNLTSVFLVCREAVPLLKWQRDGGYIVNIASMSGVHGKAGKSAYCASKFGVIGLTESIFEELKGSNVRISAVCPASVDTALTNNKHLLKKEEIEKILQPDDVARAVGELVESPKRVLRKRVELEIELQVDKYQRLKNSKM